MAKMFYTVEEVCQKLGKSADEVRAMAASGQIQEFRDRDRLMFKVDQIDLLAGGDEDSGEIALDLEATGSQSALGLTGGTGSKSGSSLGLSTSGLDLKDDSVIGLSDSREDTGISVFDTDHTGLKDEASEQTAMGGEAVEDDELSLEAVGSGSGLLDLTRESDDTSLGAELLEEVYSSEEAAEIPGGASGLFEAAGEDESEQLVGAGGAMAMPVMMEAYDGTGSGLGAGLLIGALAALVMVAIVGVVGVMGATPDLAIMFARNVWIWVGGLAAVTVVFGLIGLFLGKASE